jgi:hypothetical protein
MLQAYIPVKKTKQNKTKIRGLWYSTKQKVCYDYIRQVKVNRADIEALKQTYRQEAIFYRDIGRLLETGKAYIWYSKDKQEVLKWQAYFTHSGKAGLKAFIKNLLKRYGGVTIYIKEGQYLCEVWQ